MAVQGSDRADAPQRLALCTTVYPAVLRYLPEWYRSVAAQTDRDFDLWIALDGLDAAAVTAAAGAAIAAHWVHAAPGDSPAAIRQRVLDPIAAHYDAVVLVDSDDILHPARVEAARNALADYDLMACALRLVDWRGADLGTALTLPDGVAPAAVLPRHNLFGLSNTAWRCELLRRCLPIPADVEIVDWLLATRAWLLDARIGFERAIGMDYRQHPDNMVRVAPPFSREQILRDTARARAHFRRALETLPAQANPRRGAELAAVAQDVERFAEWLARAAANLENYRAALDRLDLRPMWWSSVAHPSLHDLWH